MENNRWIYTVINIKTNEVVLQDANIDEVHNTIGIRKSNISEYVNHNRIYIKTYAILKSAAPKKALTREQNMIDENKILKMRHGFKEEYEEARLRAKEALGNPRAIQYYRSHRKFRKPNGGETNVSL